MLEGSCTTQSVWLATESKLKTILLFGGKIRRVCVTEHWPLATFWWFWVASAIEMQALPQPREEGRGSKATINCSVVIMSLPYQQNHSPKAKSKANTDPDRNSNNYFSHNSVSLYLLSWRISHYKAPLFQQARLILELLIILK